MLKKKSIAAVAVVLGITLVTATPVLLASQAAGTPQDPLVAQSYVDQKFDQLLSLINNIGQTGGSQTSVDKPIVVSDSVSFEPVNAFKGQVIEGGEGTEIILRSGKSVAVCPGSNGIVNISNGSDTLNNATIIENNLYIVPRDDGRGVKITSDDAWFLIKGSYTIK